MNIECSDPSGGCWWTVRYDRLTGTSEVVSVSAYDPSLHRYTARDVSADGRYVVFDSLMDNVVPGDNNGCWDLFLRDVLVGETMRLSVASDGVQGNAHTRFGAVSADGRFVAFTSEASNLVPGDTNGEGDAFVHDGRTGQTTRVSVDSTGTQANGSSEAAAISLTAVEPSSRRPQAASTGRPRGSATVAERRRPPPAATRASTVPGPPSAMGARSRSASGSARRRPSAMAWAASAAERLPLNSWGAMRTRTRPRLEAATLGRRRYHIAFTPVRANLVVFQDM
jgi:hypothetical protein